MLNSIIPAPKDIIFETVLEPQLASIDRLKMERVFEGEGEIKGFHGGINKVAVGHPYSENLVSRIQTEHKEEEIPNYIKNMLNEYDFHFVTLYCSFLPDNHSRFSWARFGVKLSAKPKSNAFLTNRPPIAHDMFPDEIRFSPELKLNLLDIVEAEIIHDTRSSSEFVVYDPCGL